MPGAYAHITLVNLAKEPARLEAAGIPTPAIVALLDYFRYCELGAVSPDYPYLDVLNKDAAPWADRMHYKNTGVMIQRGVELVRNLSGANQTKALAWLLGYTAHVTADVTIHPIVELKVGEYQQNQKAHRICEMNQDAYIFQRLNVGEVGLSEHLDSGIWGCCEPQGSGQLDQTIVSVWEEMLQHCYPTAFSHARPNLHEWHSAFKNIVDKVEEGNRLAPFARHVAVNCGMTYPDNENIDFQYIEELSTPQGKMHYDAIFNIAIENVLLMWSVIAKGVIEAEPAYQSTIDNWNLDTGKDPKGHYAFWKEAA